LAELKALAKRPESEIDFSDIPERVNNSFRHKPMPLEEHTVTLRLDSEVAAWLDKAATEDANRLNWILKREAHRRRQSNATGQDLLDKAS
jgi:hypothetical protein